MTFLGWPFLQKWPFQILKTGGAQVAVAVAALGIFSFFLVYVMHKLNADSRVTFIFENNRRSFCNFQKTKKIAKNGLYEVNTL